MKRGNKISQSESNADFTNSSQNKIELLSCNSGAKQCKEHLKIINKCYSEANNYHFEKDYLNSIESLRSAFLNTTSLNEVSCVKCANLFRSTITQSIENINGELQKLTTGLFRKKRYQMSYRVSCEVLDEIRKEIR